MTKLVSALRQLLGFVREFGPGGMWLFARYCLLHFSIGSDVQALNIPRVGHLRLRKRTTDRHVFFQVFVQRGYDFSGFEQNAHLQKIYDGAVAKGELPLIIDCGANIGLSAVWYAVRYPAARVFAVEPEAGNFALLCANARPFPNIVPINAAVWDNDASLAIVDAAAAAWSFQVSESAPGESALCAVTIPAIMAQAEANRLLLAKIDIEGAEQTLFRANTDLMESTTAIAIELHDWMLPGRGSSRPFLTALARYPFEIVWRGETMFCVRMS